MESSPCQTQSPNSASERVSLRVARRWVFNYLANVWLILGVGTGALVGLRYVIPAVRPDWPAFQAFNRALLLYGLAMLVFCWRRIRNTDIAVPQASSSTASFRTSEEGPLSSSQESPGAPSQLSSPLDPESPEAPSQRPTRPYCAECRRPRLRRSHHCGLCGLCVEQHDHHCFFAARCVGRANQRYFLVFCAWVGFGLSYALGLFVPYWRGLGEGVGGRWFDFFLIPVSVTKWLLGYIAAFDLLCIGLFHSACVGAFAGWLILGAQLSLISQGLTSYEKKKKRPPEWAGQLTAYEHLKLALGPYPLLQFFVPVGPFLPLPPHPFADHQKHL